LKCLCSTEDTPILVVESDATIAAPRMLQALLECKRNPATANALLAKHRF
jgi:deoxyhypusine synthase